MSNLFSTDAKPLPVSAKEGKIIDINKAFNKHARDFKSVEELRAFLDERDADKVEVLERLQRRTRQLDEANEKHNLEITRREALIKKNNDSKIKEDYRTKEWEKLFDLRERVGRLLRMASCKVSFSLTPLTARNSAIGRES